MADINDINNQNEQNEGLNQQLSIEQELLLVLQRRAGITSETLTEQQETNNVIQDILKNLKYEVSEKRNIRNLSNQLTKIAEKSYTITDKELGLSKTRLKIEETKESIDKKLLLLTFQKNKLEEDVRKGLIEDKELYNSLTEELEKQEKSVTNVKKELEGISKESKTIEKSLGLKTFGTLSDVMSQIPGLKRFSEPFEEAAEAAREQAVHNFKFYGSTKGITKEGITQLQNIKDKIKEYDNAIEKGESFAESLKTLDDIKFNPEDIQFTDDVGEGLQKSIREGIKGGKKLSEVFKNTGIEANSIKINSKAIPKGKSLSPFKAGINSLKKSLGGLLSKAGLIGLALTSATKIFEFFKKAMFEADEQVTNMRRSLNMSRDAAEGVRDRMFEVSDVAKELTTLNKGQVLTQQDLVKAQSDFNTALGTSIDLTSALGEKGKVMLAQFANVSKFLKLSQEEQKGLIHLQTVSGEGYEDTVKQILGGVELRKAETGIMVDSRKVLESILTTSKATTLTIKGQGKSLADAAFQAAKLGLNLSDLDNTSSSLLDFSSSIEAEMQAELLTGKQLNLERARYAALMGDSATLAQELSREIGTSAEFGAINITQQEAFSKALGKSREEIAEILINQEALNELKTGYNTLGDVGLEHLKKQGKVSEELYNRIKAGTGGAKDYFKALQEAGLMTKELAEAMGEQSFANLSAQTAQEKWNDTLSKAQGIFSRLVDGGVLQNLANLLEDVVTYLSGGSLEQVRSKRKSKEAEAISSSTSSSSTISSEELSKLQKAKKEIEEQIKDVDRTSIRDFLHRALGGGRSNVISRSNENSQLILLNKSLENLEKEIAKSSPNVAQDFISRPGQPIQKFRADDIIIGATKPFETSTKTPSKEFDYNKVSNKQDPSPQLSEIITNNTTNNTTSITNTTQPPQPTNSKEMISLLKELVTVVKQGGDIYIDGSKVGKSLAMATSQMG